MEVSGIDQQCAKVGQPTADRVAELKVQTALESRV